MIGRIIGIIIGICLIVNSILASDHSEYYYQRVDLFDKLPACEDDIIFLGNSITNGCEWFELFKNPNLKNRGINGDKAIGVRDRLASTLRGKPSKVFLMIGVNDIANGASPDSVISVMKVIIENTKELSPNTQLYVQSILPINDTYDIFYGHMDKSEQIAEYNAKLEALCDTLDVPFIDLYSHFKNEDNDRMNLKYTNDGLHLTGEGYLLWKSLVDKYVNE